MVIGKIAILITETGKTSCHILIVLADTSLFPRCTVYFQGDWETTMFHFPCIHHDIVAQAWAE